MSINAYLRKFCSNNGEKMIDRRNEKTEQAILSAFFEQIKSKPLNKISVAELCRNANIGRGTFYLHYADVYDLFEKIESKIFEKLINIFESAFPTTNEEKSNFLTINLTDYVSNNKEVFQILIRDDNEHSLYKLKKLFYNKVLAENIELLPKGDPNFSIVESVFVVSGVIGILEKWICDGFTISKTEIAQILNRIIVKINKN